MAFTNGGINHVENATAAVNAALYAVARLRDRRGYLLSPEDAHDLDLIEAKLVVLQDIYLQDVRTALAEANAVRQGKHHV